MKVFIFLTMLLLCSSFSYAEGLDTLIAVARSQGDIQKAYKEETETFNDVKRAVDKGSIKNGQSKEEIRKKYGEPVISTQDFTTKREKWVYKPAASTYSEGIRIYLFFDKDSNLDEILVEGQGEAKN
ncbi:MAG: hypothetical protein WC738_00935 [Candidatus Omnitrophota bacterium]|jgi:hypothetical protein